jgi:hypothetical protein
MRDLSGDIEAMPVLGYEENKAELDILSKGVFDVQVFASSP